MIVTFRKAITAALFAAAIGSLPAPAAALDEKEKEEIGAFIREYLIANPEILFEVQDALEAKQREQQREQSRLAIATSGDALFHSPDDVVMGNPNGSVTIVEFFDYNCGFCKRALRDMEQIIASDPDVRFVLKEFPILGEDSVDAHRVSAAVTRVAPDHYEAFHLELLGGSGRATEARAIDIAVSLGIDEAQLRDTMDDPAIMESFRQTYLLADSLGITGTPSYVIGDEAVFGAVGFTPLSEKVANLRTCDSTVC